MLEDNTRDVNMCKILVGKDPVLWMMRDYKYMLNMINESSTDNSCRCRNRDEQDIRFCRHWWYYIQLNLDISNSVKSKSRLYRTDVSIPAADKWLSTLIIGRYFEMLSIANAAAGPGHSEQHRLYRSLTRRGCSLAGEMAVVNRPEEIW